ncbi:MAG: hypothetical protein J2P28_16305 [Actinobacteria bacterium]|nr:hypothetical protein [Actinomycetota bacterium]MBO0837052.1 hypothetical protein [Actinomycetota bacterium]
MHVWVRHGTVAALCALALAGCSTAKPSAATVHDCGATRSAANVPIEVEVDRGQVPCSMAMQVEAGYAKAIVNGQVQTNGGEAPATINGWACKSLDTPEMLKTGVTSRCVKKGLEIVAILKVASPGPSSS